MSFKNKVVIVTGSSSGIGASTAIEFAKEGAQVVLVGRNEAKLTNVREQCEKVGKKPLIVKADVSKDDDAKTIINKTIEHFGKLDVLVNNAGMGGWQDILKDGFMETYDRIMNINLRAPVYITHLAIPYLIKSKGNIINVSSVAGISTVGLEDSTPYCISKAGISHFSRSVALKLAPYGIRVNTVSPGPVYTDILANSSADEALFEQFKRDTALKRVSEPKEIADLILFLASDKAKGITGSDFVSDNGRLIK
ncbi:unnamed protein product [Parnassius apollo]|uniref:(apollo) hypothetical protein n=1 Tax=Parnassius apollo TaxID=110799 RepID=A0A8S3WM52_PARAO|nr:unnamed protein product [Parnassius apollo]